MPELRFVFHCTQCGGNRFDPAETAGHVCCAYCGSEYEVVRHRTEVERPEPHLFVQGHVVVEGDVALIGGVRLEDGARLTVDETSDLRVEGDVHVADGATLDLRGDLRLVRPAPEEAVRKALRRVAAEGDDAQ
jgi:hypothetical protein